MSITIDFAYEIVVLRNSTLTPKARLEMHERLIHYLNQRQKLLPILDNANSAIMKIEKILEIDAKLKISE